jgi:hypothetical protein
MQDNLFKKPKQRRYLARQIVALILQHTKVVGIKSYAHALHTLLLRIIVLQNNSKFYMSNPCNCIQYARQSFIFFFSNCFQCRIFCYVADKYYFVILHDYFLQFPHGLIPAESQKMRKRKKSTCGNKMVLSDWNAEPHEHNIINAAH